MSAPIPGNPIKDDPKLQQLLDELDSTSGNRQYQQPRTATIISALSSENPIKDDPKLQQLLKDLDSVNSNEQFQRWKNSFLKEFEAFLGDADKTARAELIFAEFGANLAKLTKLLKQLQGFLENGDLTADTCTVKARQCLTEVGRQTTVVILQTEALVPGTSAEENKAGYTKFNVGAALIRDGFVQYGRLQACTEVFEHLRTKTCVEQVADRQILQEMELHGVKASIFFDVMADLGIFKVLTRCRELDVMEAFESDDEVKPHGLENEAPTSPQRPKKSPAKPQTPKSSKTPKEAKLSDHEDLTVMSIPPAKGSYGKSEKAVQARRIGKVDGSSPAEKRRREEDQYKPVEWMDKNLNRYYHGSDGPSPFFFLDKKRHDLLQKVDKPKSDMRPSTTRGASFGDVDGDGGVPEKAHDLLQKVDKPKSDIRPSTMRGASFSEDDGSGVPEKPSELVQKPDKPKGGMRPSTMRGASFSDGECGGIPEKSHEPPSGMAPSTMRRTSSGDDDGVTQQSTLMRLSPVKRVENQPIDPARIKDEKERNKDTDQIKNQVKSARIPSDDIARGIEGTPNHQNLIAFIDVKARGVQSAPTKKKKAVDLVKRRKCLMWYARMSQPNRADMKRRVANLPESCDITVDDVDDLPWMRGDKILSVIEMNKLFLQL